MLWLLLFVLLLLLQLVGHQAWQIGGRVFCFGGLEINEDDAGPLRPVPVHRVVVVDACGETEL